MSNLKGRIAIVSGAAQGIGAAFSRRLAAEGAQVLAFDRQASINTVFSGESNIETMQADVSVRADVEAVVARAAALGGIDVLINNASVWRKTPVDSPWEQALADWDAVMDTNVKGTLMLSRACVPHLIERGGGDIVNVSTYYVLPARSAGTNPPDTDLYNASKWALNGFTDAWAKYLAKHQIRVNGLCMGPTDTPMLRGLFADGEYPSALKEVMLQPEDIAQQLMDLLDDGRTGENIGAWAGAPATLPPRADPHRRITG